jgi:hypothetical protein
MECTMPATLEPIRSLPAAAHVLRVPRATTPVAMRRLSARHAPPTTTPVLVLRRAAHVLRAPLFLASRAY